MAVFSMPLYPTPSIPLVGPWISCLPAKPAVNYTRPSLNADPFEFSALHLLHSRGISDSCSPMKGTTSRRSTTAVLHMKRSIPAGLTLAGADLHGAVPMGRRGCEESFQPEAVVLVKQVILAAEHGEWVRWPITEHPRG